MKLRYITCSGPREDTSIQSILNFAEKYPICEFGIKAIPIEMSYRIYRRGWFNQMVFTCSQMKNQPNIALHTYYEWCDCICRGVIPIEIATWINARNEHSGEPVIKRIQLNIGNNGCMFNIENLVKLINQHKDQEFIFTWNKAVAPQIEELKKTGAKFSLLFDGNTGIKPYEWCAPVYNDIQNGYSGGLGPNNIATNLNKINKILPQNYETWIDAENRLRDIYETGAFSLGVAERYVKEAIDWQKQH